MRIKLKRAYDRYVSLSHLLLVKLYLFVTANIIVFMLVLNAVDFNKQNKLEIQAQDQDQRRRSCLSREAGTRRVAMATPIL